MTGPGHRSIRLSLDRYAVEDSVWLVTSCTRERQPTFRNPNLARRLMEIIEERCDRAGAIPWAYCVMPDHFHLLVQLGATDLMSLVKEIKSITTRAWWIDGGKGSLWQTSFHDRGIRETEDMIELARYIINNPVRAGLAHDVPEYPFVGGRMVSNE